MTSFQSQFTSLKENFLKIYGGLEEHIRYFFAPGRVNLIGEHIDYCGGHVLPCAIAMGTFAAARKSCLSNVTMKSTFFNNFVSFFPKKPRYLDEDGWGNYPKGVFAEYNNRGLTSRGCEILFHGNIAGGGLSSSASIELCTALIIESFNDFHLVQDDFENRKQMALLCQQSENRFNGMNCGIMDQISIALGKSGKAMLIDCHDLKIDYVPIELGEYRLIIGNTCKARKLIESKYNERRIEVEKALAILTPHLSIKKLCDLSIQDLESAPELLNDPILLKRTRHVVTENFRVHEAVKSLKDKNIPSFAHLLNESHQSLRLDYEVSGKELDTLVQASIEQPGVLGARMTGAGFGGCMIAIVHNDAIAAYEHKVSQIYDEAIGYPPQFYETAIGPGAHSVNLNV